MLNNALKRRITYTVLMVVMGAFARYLVNRWFPEEDDMWSS